MDKTNTIILIIGNRKDTKIYTINLKLKELHKEYQLHNKINISMVKDIKNIISNHKNTYWGPKMDKTTEVITQTLIKHPSTESNIFNWITLFSNIEYLNKTTETIQDEYLLTHIKNIDQENLTMIYKRIWSWFKDEYINTLKNKNTTQNIETLSTELHRISPLTKRQSEAIAGVYFSNNNMEELSTKLGISKSRIYEARQNAETKLTRQFLQFGLTTNFLSNT